MNFLNYAKDINIQINNLEGYMYEDLAEIENHLNEYVKVKEIHGYEFVRNGGRNIGLNIYPNARTNPIELGYKEYISVNNFKELSPKIVDFCESLNQYMFLVNSNQRLNERFLSIAPFNHLINSTVLRLPENKKTNLKK